MLVTGIPGFSTLGTPREPNVHPVGYGTHSAALEPPHAPSVDFFGVAYALVLQTTAGSAGHN